MKWLLVGLLCGGVQVMSGQSLQQWMNLYDADSGQELHTSVALLSDTTYRIAVSDVSTNVGLLHTYGVSTEGDTLWRK